MKSRWGANTGQRLLLARLAFLALHAGAQVSTLEIPLVGHTELRILTPTMLEAFLVSTQGPGATERPSACDWVDENGALNAAFERDTARLVFKAEGIPVPVRRMGFRRLPLFAPLPSKARNQGRDLRLGNSLFIELSEPLAPGVRVEIGEPDVPLVRFSARADSRRVSPVLHINETGYEPAWAKHAQVGYFCGSLGELTVPDSGFEIVREPDDAVAFSGRLTRRPDTGFTQKPAPYQQVWEADFSALRTPGHYRLRVAGLGVSESFSIEAGVSGALARTLALGLFHQRDGANRQELPWTRFVDGPAHLAPAQVLTDAREFSKAWSFVSKMSAPPKEQSAPALRDFSSALYPPVLSGAIDVSGGHHDAGDYSKYTINSAGALAVLSFAADSLGAAGTLDNLGIPESGDGISDLLQEAKVEADFLAKMQDTDGGFWFLVYPKNRPYEEDVLPGKGDAQVLFPKNTSATAASVGALAQAGSSPAMQAAYPEAAALYRKKAAAGWDFLERAIAKHGLSGAYQKVTHYGDVFGHADELAFAAAAMFAMSGEKRFEDRLKQWAPEPGAAGLRRWNWWPLFESYGHAFRVYGFALRSGRLKPGQLDAEYLSKVQGALMAAGEAALRSSKECAYGTSFDGAFKRPLNASYHFSGSIAFDLAVAAELTADAPKREALREALIANLAYSTGSNPANQCFVTGLGTRPLRNVVSQFAQNSPRALAPSGLPVGEICAIPGNAGPYRTADGKNLIAQLIFPGTTPLYDRFVDSFNTSSEATIYEQARAALSALWLFAQSPLATQKWSAPRATIVSAKDRLHMETPGLDLSTARILWESEGKQPRVGPGIPEQTGWVEAEADFPDGRRVFARRVR